LNSSNIIISAVGRLKQQARMEPFQMKSNARTVHQEATI